MRSIVVGSVLAALALAGCSSHRCGCRHTGCHSGCGSGAPVARPQGLPPPGVPPAPRTAAERNTLPGTDYAKFVAAHERRGEADTDVDVAGVWARTRQDGGAYFAGGGSSAADTHMKVNKAP